MLSAYKWRIILPVTMILLLLALSPSFFHGLFAYSWNLFFVVMALTLVPRTICNVAAKYQLGHLYWTHGHWALFLFCECLVLVALFWCWIGWKIDLKAQSRGCSRAWAIAEIVLTAGCSLVIFQLRAEQRLPPYPNASELIAIMWSVILLGYSLQRLSQLWRTRHQATR